MNDNQNNSNQWDDNNMQSTGFRSGSDDQNSSKGVSNSKGKQGFSGMSPDKRSSIAAKGGKVAHQKGTAHEWTSKEAAEAGRKGGQNSRSNRQKSE